VTNTAVVGLQWGDEGKGKVVDYLSEHFSATVRYNGGNNAGHTVEVGGKRYVFHALPSSALRGKPLFVGPGAVLDPDSLEKELSALRPLGSPQVKVDIRCTLITPFEKWLDGQLERLRGASAIGTTGMGIGPAYASRMLRVAPRVADLVAGRVPDYSPLAGLFPGAPVPDEAWASRASSLLSPVAANVPAELSEMAQRGEGVLFEAAQGALLDVSYGTYPYVTSSHTTASYVGPGAGFPVALLDEVIGVFKAYQTRVGAGPFPTEFFGPTAESIRSRGGEFGATTGRPRRVGWLDLVSLKYASSINEPSKLKLFMTKADVLSGERELKVAVAYSVDGSETEDFTSLVRGNEVRPVYQDLEPIPNSDWGSVARGGWDALPPQLKRLIDLVEDYVGREVMAVSLGPGREMTVERGRRDIPCGREVQGGDGRGRPLPVGEGPFPREGICGVALPEGARRN